KVENPANVRIRSVENIAQNAPYVDINQSFKIRTIVENNGEDAARQIVVNLSSDSSSWIANPSDTLSILSGGSADTLLFNITAAGERILEEIFTARIDSAMAENTIEPDGVTISPANDSTAQASVQLSGIFKIDSVSTSVNEINALSTEKWQIIVSVKNEGEGELTLNQPAVSNLTFLIGDELQQDYSISAPEAFSGSQALILSAGEEDQLIYQINRTGFKGGIVNIRTTLSGGYHNTGLQFEESDSTEIYVRPSADVFVNITAPLCPNVDQFGIGQVNQGQKFSVRSVIKNAGAERVDQVVVNLSAEGYPVKRDTIEFIPPSGESTAIFNITALEPATRVAFGARILSAFAHESGLPAAIGAASDSIASVRVHSPALLKIAFHPSDTLFTAGLMGAFRMSVENLGTAEVDNSGKLSVSVPAGYSLVRGETHVLADTVQFVAGEEFSLNILPPTNASTADTIRAFLFTPPRDKNTNAAALVLEPYGNHIIKTVPSNIHVEEFDIVAPEGARDNLLSTGQRFNVQLRVRISENLDSAKTTLSIPNNFGFAIGEDSVKSIDGQNVSWRLIAPEAPVSDSAVIKVTVRGAVDGQVYTVTDSIAVVVQRHAILVLDDVWISWPPQTSSTLSSGQNFDLSVMVKSKFANQALVTGTALLRINFGATGVTTQQPLIRSFKVDSTVVWRLKAPDVQSGLKPITVFLESVPNDVNTNEPAQVWAEQTRVDFYIETVASAQVNVESFQITSPYGATDRILSTSQNFTVEAFINWRNCKQSPSVTLLLPPGFTT
ncbi:MAG: hypothetical protein SCK70_11085, partial [bacterium]|nr:hypothetical protein [bacterium]